MFQILDGDHEKSVKHEGAAKRGIGGLAPVETNHTEVSRHEEFKHGGKVGHAHHKAGHRAMKKK
jgi:hypothetical protein